MPRDVRSVLPKLSTFQANGKRQSSVLECKVDMFIGPGSLFVKVQRSVVTQVVEPC